MEGFIVFDYEKEYPRALKDLAQWLAEGKIKRKETIVKGGLQNAESALRDLYAGRNTGKYAYFPYVCCSPANTQQVKCLWKSSLLKKASRPHCRL